ncbi:MAG: GFA family protein [Pikeienuella sp.]
MTLTKGQCLCGAVTVKAELRSSDEVSFQGEDNINLYRASEWGERGFCNNCGSTLFWRKAGEKGGELAVGLFAGQAGLSLTKEIYIDRRPSWLPHSVNAAQWTEAEIEAVYAAREGQNSDEAGNV